MRYDHIPRPEIEQHYHIRELIERQEKRVADRNYHREKAKESSERDSLIKDSKIVVLTDFWCEGCSKDFKSISIRQVEADWSCPTQNIAFYKTKCECGKWCIRLITDKNRDGYWTRSRGVARDRGRHYADTIQPGETGFNMLYKKLK